MDYEKKKKNRKMIIKIVSAQVNMNSVSWNDLLGFLETFSVAVEEITDCTYHQVFWR